MTSYSKRSAAVFTALSVAALGAVVIGLTGAACAQQFTKPGISTPSESHLHLAQAKQEPPPKLIVDVAVQSKAGEKLKFPARLEPAGADTAQFVMLHQVPAWLKVVGGEAIGNGVWLVPARALAKTELQFEATATGRQEIVVSLLAANGTDVQSESKLMVTVAAAAANAPRTWQSLVGAGAGANEPAPTSDAKTASSPGTAGSPTAGAGALSAFPANTRTDAEMVQYARHLVRECTTCHSLFGTDVGVPVMVGLSRERFIDTMNLYKTGRRDHGPMKAVAESLDESETLALALYLGRIRPAVATAAPSATGATGPVASSTVVLAKRSSVEKPERIEGWLKRGQDFLKAGEVGQARLMFERAAEHGNAMGAYLLGTTFDPNVLVWRPGMGLEAEPARAREWYMIAKQLGPVPQVDQRLADLR